MGEIGIFFHAFDDFPSKKLRDETVECGFLAGSDLETGFSKGTLPLESV